MFDKHSIRIDKTLLAQSAEHARALGYEGVEELVVHLLECELAGRDASGQSAVAGRLRGLGYIE